MSQSLPYPWTVTAPQPGGAGPDFAAMSAAEVEAWKDAAKARHLPALERRRAAQGPQEGTSGPKCIEVQATRIEGDGAAYIRFSLIDNGQTITHADHPAGITVAEANRIVDAMLSARLPDSV